MDGFSDLIKARPYRGRGKRTGSPGHYTYDYGTEGRGQIGLFSGVVEAAKAPQKRRADAARRQLTMFADEAPHVPGAAAPKHSGSAKPAAPGQAGLFDAPKDTKTIDVEDAIAAKTAARRTYVEAIKQKLEDATGASVIARPETRGEGSQRVATGKMLWEAEVYSEIGPPLSERAQGEEEKYWRDRVSSALPGSSVDVYAEYDGEVLIVVTEKA